MPYDHTGPDHPPRTAPAIEGNQRKAPRPKMKDFVSAVPSQSLGKLQKEQLKDLKARLKVRQDDWEKAQRTRYVIAKEPRVTPKKPKLEDILPSKDSITGKKVRYKGKQKKAAKEQLKKETAAWKKKHGKDITGGILSPEYQANLSVLYGHNPQPTQIRSGGVISRNSPYQEGLKSKKRILRKRTLFSEGINMAIAGLAAVGAMVSEQKADTTPATEPAHAEQTIAMSARNVERALERGAPLTFEKAHEYANRAAGATGVDLSVILAVMLTESNFGQHMGDAYLTDPETGVGMSHDGRTLLPNVMKPDRDVRPFFELMHALGRDPYTSPVSRPIIVRGHPYGFGGAMGYSQTIPSEWMRHRVPELRALADPGGTARIQNSVVRELTGMEFAPLDPDFKRLLESGQMLDPLDPETASMAIGVALRDNGCAGVTSFEQLAPCLGMYYSGAGWETDSHDYIRRSFSNITKMRQALAAYDAENRELADAIARAAVEENTPRS